MNATPSSPLEPTPRPERIVETINFPLLQAAVEHGPPEGWKPPEPDVPDEPDAA